MEDTLVISHLLREGDFLTLGREGDAGHGLRNVGSESKAESEWQEEVMCDSIKRLTQS